ncbi:MAG: hypothetical protein WBE73_20275 [Candidatus Acidiferrum sp.]
MNVGLKIAATILLAATGLSPSLQAQSCAARILPYVYDDTVGMILAPGVTADQSEWLRKTAKKKYPGFCFTASATYVMVTIRGTASRTRTETKTESAVTTGPITAVVGQTGGGTGQPPHPVWNTQLGTWVTTWQRQQTETVPEPYAVVLIFETKDGKQISPTSQVRLAPVLQAKGVGSHASRDALEFALQHWDMKLTSCSDGSTAESCK